MGTEDRFAKTGSGQTQAQLNVKPAVSLCFAAQGIELMVTFWPFMGMNRSINFDEYLEKGGETSFEQFYIKC